MNRSISLRDHLAFFTGGNLALTGGIKAQCLSHFAPSAIHWRIKAISSFDIFNLDSGGGISCSGSVSRVSISLAFGLPGTIAWFPVSLSFALAAVSTSKRKTGFAGLRIGTVAGVTAIGEQRPNLFAERNRRSVCCGSTAEDDDRQQRETHDDCLVMSGGLPLRPRLRFLKLRKLSFFSRGAAVSNSLGREPKGMGRNNVLSPGGATAKSIYRAMSPLRGFAWCFLPLVLGFAPQASR